MDKPRIILEISERGITETGIVAQSDEESAQAHKLLAAVAPQLRALNAGLKVAGLERVSIK